MSHCRKNARSSPLVENTTKSQPLLCNDVPRLDLDLVVVLKTETFWDKLLPSRVYSECQRGVML